MVTSRESGHGLFDLGSAVMEPVERRSLFVGVTGGSASGKTTFARELVTAVGAERCGVLFQDSYYIDQSRKLQQDGDVNFDHPSAIDFDLLSAHLEGLKRGAAVAVPEYDFATHRRKDSTVTFTSQPIIVVDGILILTSPRVRELMDVTVYIDTDEDIRFARRLKRDVEERGRQAEGVRRQFMAHVKPMHDQFIEPCKGIVDLVFKGVGDLKSAVHQTLERLQL